jgi:hypothetical protein
LREEYRLRVFANEVLRNIFGPKGDEVKGEWRRLRNKELYDLHSSLNYIRMINSSRMRLAAHVARKRDRRGAFRILVGRLEGDHLE